MGKLANSSLRIAASMIDHAERAIVVIAFGVERDQTFKDRLCVFELSIEVQGIAMLGDLVEILVTVVLDFF